METNVYQAPSAKLVESKTKRPLLLSLFVVLTSIFSALIFFSSVFVPYLTDDRENQIVGILMSITSFGWLVSMIGVWRLKYWGIWGVLASAVIHQIGLFSIGTFVFKFWVFPVVMFILCFYYRDKFSGSKNG